MSQEKPATTSRTASPRSAILIGITVLVIVLVGLIIVWPDDVPVSEPTLVRELEHPMPEPNAAYTQGLEYVDGEIWEGTGQRGASRLRRLDPKTGKLLPPTEEKINPRKLSGDFFGEGITVLGEHLWQLTYTSQVALRYRVDQVFDEKMRRKGADRFSYAGEGWGLTNDGTHLIMSNGSNEITVRRPDEEAKELETVEVVKVVRGTEPVDKLNELELVQGDLYANRFQTNEIVVIQWSQGGKLPRGHVKRLIECAKLDPGDENPEHVLNGIAWWPELEAGVDQGRRRLLVTGKNWPKMFVIEFDDR